MDNFTYTTVTVQIDGKYFSFYGGHVEFDVFKKAFNIEWAKPGSSIVFMRSDLKYEWWFRKSPTEWTKTQEGAKWALPVTVLEW